MTIIEKTRSIINRWFGCSVWLVGLAILFLVFSRIYQLASFPVGFFPDEMVYLIEARSLAELGSPFTESWQPWKLEPLGVMWAELPAVFLSLGYLLSDNVLLGARIIPSLMGLSLPLLFSWLMLGLTDNRRIAWAGLVVAICNPWFWQFSRMSFDPLFSLWFYVLGLALMINLKGYCKNWAILSFFLGFFQYQGLKLILLPVVWLFALYYLIAKKHFQLSKLSWKALKKSIFDFWQKRNPSSISIMMIGLATGCLIFIYVGWLLPGQGAMARLTNTIWSDQEYLEEISLEVNTQRRLSFDQSIVTRLFANKAIIHLKKIADSYLRVFNLQNVFMFGEPEYSLFAAFSHGFFLLIDLPMLIYGLAILLTDKRLKLLKYLLLSLLIIAPVPALINTTNDWLVFRSAFLYLVILMIVAVGWGQLLEQRSLVTKIMLLLLAANVADFAFHYNFRYPLYSANGVRFQERVLSNYLARTPADRQVVVFHPDPSQFIKYLYLFKKEITQADVALLRTQLADHPEEIEFGQILIRSGCLDSSLYNPSIQTLILSPDIKECELDDNDQGDLVMDDLLIKPLDFKKGLSIASLVDSGEQYFILGDQVCSSFQPAKFMHIQSLNLTHVEYLSNQQFCENWILDLSDLRGD